MDWFLIVAIVIAFLILLVAGVYLIVHFQHPDDKNEAWFPKLVVLLGFVLAGSTVLLLPLDVANGENYPGCSGYDTKLCGGLNMVLFWEIMYMLTLVWLVILIPFSVFFYEADDGTLLGGPKRSRILEAIKYQFFVIFIIGVIFTLCYLFLSYTNIPVQSYTAPRLTFVPQYTTDNLNGTDTTFTPLLLPPIGNADITVANAITTLGTTSETRRIQLSVPTFFIALMGFLGWFIFAIFGGVGLPSLPLDLILAFVHRPRHMDAVEMAEAQVTLRERVNELVEIGELLKIERDQKKAEEAGGGNKSGGFLCFGKKGGGSGGGSSFASRRKANKNDRKTLLQFKQAVYLLEKDNDDFKDCTENYNNYNPLIPWAQLFCGCLSLLLSILWLLQICIFVLPPNPPTGFLNSYFMWLDSWFPLFGVLSVALFTVYLLFCATKGCFKFGLRFFWFTLYPMKINGTYMSSFLFNTALILLCSVPVVQLSTTAFASYARYTNALQLFGTQIQYLEFFKYFFENNVFVYALVVITALTTIYLICRPRDNATSALELRDRLKSRSA